MLAAQLAQRYLGTAFACWQSTGKMFEKYNATGTQNVWKQGEGNGRVVRVHVVHASN